MAHRVIRASLLLPGPRAGEVDFVEDGVLRTSGNRVVYVGPAGSYARAGGDLPRPSAGIVMPGMWDVHTHVPQHRVRGRFLEGVEPDPPGGRLLAGLSRNIFPAEARWSDPEVAAAESAAFATDARSRGVVGGCCFLTSHPQSWQAAAETLPPGWRIGPVLMNQECPRELRFSWQQVERLLAELVSRWGERVWPADRFALACSSGLRRAAATFCATRGLRMQTHLAEQSAEVQEVARQYPQSRDYLDVYATDGLLATRPIFAHCVHLSPSAWDRLASAGAAVAHCPTSNQVLGSGTMPVAETRIRHVPTAIATDVGASPTTSLLAEAAKAVEVHAGNLSAAEAVWRITRGAAEVLGLGEAAGHLVENGPAVWARFETDAAGSVEAVCRTLIEADPAAAEVVGEG